jgi:Glucosamine-6-phosphate isomerases/6-phosphogluconolactonase
MYPLRRAWYSIVALIVLDIVAGFTASPIAVVTAVGSRQQKSCSSPDSGKLWAAPAQQVWILPTEQEVTLAVHKVVEDAARLAIAERGNFALAIPGGSVLKVLSTMEAGDWVSKTTLAYVNHKCVPNDDISSSIHAKVSVDPGKHPSPSLSAAQSIHPYVTLIFFNFLTCQSCYLGQQDVSGSMGIDQCNHIGWIR